MTRFTGGLLQFLIGVVSLGVLIGTAYVGLNGINSHDIRFLLAAVAGVLIFIGMWKLFQYVEAQKQGPTP